MTGNVWSFFTHVIAQTVASGLAHGVFRTVTETSTVLSGGSTSFMIIHLMTRSTVTSGAEWEIDTELIKPSQLPELLQASVITTITGTLIGVIKSKKEGGAG
jgi:hypothetical protein